MQFDPFLEDRVMAASNVELVRILFRAALGEVARARQCLACGDVLGRSRALSKASGMVGELSNSLVETPESSAFCAEMRRLYDFVLYCFASAHAEQREAPLADAERVLGSLLEGWEAAPDAGDELAGVDLSGPAAAGGGVSRLSFQG
jgi:flagellar biosynthetic protein FliS